MEKAELTKSPFHGEEWRVYRREQLLQRILTRFAETMRNKRWVERVKSEIRSEEVESLLQSNQEYHGKLESEYLELKARRLTEYPAKFQHAAPRTQQSQRAEMGLPDSLMTFSTPTEDFSRIRILAALYGDCFLTGRNPITTFRDPGRDDIKVDGGSTKAHTFFQRQGLPAAVHFEISLKDVKKWYRWDGVDWINLFREAAFTLPPAPCDGRLTWQTDVSFSNYGFVDDAEIGILFVGAASATIPDVSAPVVDSNVENLTANLFEAYASTNEFGPSVHFSGELDVVQGQVSQIFFTIWAGVVALGGLVEAVGTVGFHDPIAPSHSGAAEGLRYTFLTPF